MTANRLGPSVSTAASVANELLSLADKESAPIDQMKLQKLLFYAHAWYLGTYSAPLFDEDFEAWPWGPVVRDIFTQTTDFGRKPITNKMYEIDFTDNKLSLVTPNGADTAALQKFIKEVWDVHKGFTGIQLSNSTHAQGEPWTVIKEQYGSLGSKPTIPNSLIASIYKSKVDSDNTAT